jgi:hypothetical protein
VFCPISHCSGASYLWTLCLGPQMHGVRTMQYFYLHLKRKTCSALLGCCYKQHNHYHHCDMKGEGIRVIYEYMKRAYTNRTQVEAEVKLKQINFWIKRAIAAIHAKLSTTITYLPPCFDSFSCTDIESTVTVVFVQIPAQ